jgi:hypothetical protein
MRHQNHIIYVIFKIKGPKYIFPKTSSTPSIFDVFLILISILSNPPLSMNPNQMAFNEDQIIQNKTLKTKTIFLKINSAMSSVS